MVLILSWTRFASVLLFLTSTFFSSIASTASTSNSYIPSSTYILTPDGTNSNLTVSINVPADAKNDDLYFHFSAPSAQSWAAFGFGHGMADALIFVIYPSGSARNVTVSPRVGMGHVEPKATTDIEIDLLAGSGIIDDTYIAKFRCTNCRSWTAGSANVSSDSQPMIYAVGAVNSGSGPTIQTDLQTETIRQHMAFGKFSLDMKAATGQGGVPISTEMQTGAVDKGGNNDGRGVSTAVHAVLMLAAFVVIFPAGALFFRLLERIWIHQVIQGLGVFVVIIGSAGGIYISVKHDHHPHLNTAHQAIGLTVLSLVLTQLTLGAVHHTIYLKTHNPTILGKIHRYAGPAVIFLGLVNGAVGFNFADNNRLIIGYVVVVLLMIIVVGTLLFLKRRRQNKKAAMNTHAAGNFRQGQVVLQQFPQQLSGGVPLPPQYTPPEHMRAQQQQQQRV